MRYLLLDGNRPPLFVHARCEDELLVKAELLLFAEDAAQAYPGRAIVGSYDVAPGISIGDLKRAYRQDEAGYQRLLSLRQRILRQGWPYPEWPEEGEKSTPVD